MSAGLPALQLAADLFGARERALGVYQSLGRIMLSLIMVTVALLVVGTAWIWLPLVSVLADRLADETWRERRAGASADVLTRHPT